MGEMDQIMKGLREVGKASPPSPSRPVRSKVPRYRKYVKVICERCMWYEGACSKTRNILSKVVRREPIEGRCEWYQVKRQPKWWIP